MKYHPDLNHSPGAKQKFLEINSAYNELISRREEAENGAPTYEEVVAEEVIRRERERMRRHAKAKREKRKEAEAYFNRPEWHDPILLLRYALHLFALVFALAAIIIPVLLAILRDPGSLAGTFFFIVVGVFLIIYIYQQKGQWFRLGKFRSTWKDLAEFMSMKKGAVATDWCCYCRNTRADGQSYTVELLKTTDIRITSFGALDHAATYKSKLTKVVIPRSARAHFFHKLSSLLKLTSIGSALLFFPVESILWRFLAGILAGGILSTILLALARVRPKANYLLTPGLLIKGLIWTFSICMISKFGPGFTIRTTGDVYIVLAGLLFLLDMVFDLVMGFFPFYHRMFRPVVPQGTVLESLYRKGYQNNLELPVYSVLFPLYKWLF